MGRVLGGLGVLCSAYVSNGIVGPAESDTRMTILRRRLQCKAKYVVMEAIYIEYSKNFFFVLNIAVASVAWVEARIVG